MSRVIFALVLAGFLLAESACGMSSTTVSEAESRGSTPQAIVPSINTYIPTSIAPLLDASTSDAQFGWTLFPGGNEINSLITDGGNIWAATSGGVVRWDPDTARYQIYTIQDGLPDERVLSIVRDSRGNIWAATNFDLVRFDGARWTAVPDRPSQGNIQQICADGFGNIWVVTVGGQTLSLYDGRSWQTPSVIAGLPSPVTVGPMVNDQKGNLWVSFGQGVGRYDGSSWRIFTTADGMAGTRVLAMLVDNHNNLWCTTDQGVSRYDGTRWQNFVPDSTISDNYVSSIVQDSQGNIWVGNSQSVDCFDGQQWQAFATGRSSDPEVLAVDRAGNLWTEDQSGLSCFDGKSWKTFSAADGMYSGVSPDIFGTTAVFDRAGSLWFGTNNGIYHYDGKSWQALVTAAGPAGSTVVAMFRDRNGLLWFGTDLGVSTYDGKTWRTFTPADGLVAGNFISPNFFQDAQGNIWFASEAGINRYDGKSWRLFGAADGIDMQYLDHVSSIAQDGAGNIWFATLYSKPMSMLVPGYTYPPDINQQPAGGIYRFDGKSWQKFTTADGLVSNQVQAIAADTHGNLWFGTNQGVSRFDGTTWSSFALGQADNWVHVIFMDKAGALWFSTDEGLSRFDGASWESFPAVNGKLAEDEQGNLWAGGNWLYRFDGESWLYIARGGGPQGINALTVGPDGTVWMGTNLGLVKFDGTSWQAFPVAYGLQFNNINGVLADGNGNVWCETAYGLVCYHPDSALAR